LHTAVVGEHIVGVTGAGVEMQQLHGAVHEGVALEARDERSRRPRIQDRHFVVNVEPLFVGVRVWLPEGTPVLVPLKTARPVPLAVMVPLTV